MSLDYTWSYDPIFPADVFLDPRVAPLLAKSGIAFEHLGNQVIAFHEVDTAIALAKANFLILETLLDMGLSLAPHSARQSGDQIGGRTRFVVTELSKIADKNTAGEMTDEVAKLLVFNLFQFVSENVIRRVVRDTETKKLRPDPKLIAALSGVASKPFDLEACVEALDAGPSDPQRNAGPTPSRVPEGITLTATVLLDREDESAAVMERISKTPELLEGFEICDLTPSSFVARRGDTTLGAVALNIPFPREKLKSFFAGNAFAMNTWEVSAETKAHVHLVYTRKADGLATRADAMTLARAASAIGGRAVIWGPAEAVIASDAFAGTVTASNAEGTWPTQAILRMRIYKEDSHCGIALRGLAPFTGYDIALACDADAHLPQVAGRALGLAGWILDTRPHFADGDTMGVEGAGTAQMRVHEAKGADGTLVYEFRPYDGPAAPHTPEERAEQLSKARSESSRLEVHDRPDSGKRRSRWKFWRS